MSPRPVSGEHRLYCEELGTPIGQLRMVSHSLGVVGLGFEEGWDRIHRGVVRRFPNASWETPKRPSRALLGVELYFRGDMVCLDSIPVWLEGTTFQERVWKALGGIGLGETKSYGEIAREVGSPRAFRAVGSANRANPVSLIVPCHRVIAADGSLSGYGWGPERKRWLLDFEKRFR